MFRGVGACPGVNTGENPLNELRGEPRQQKEKKKGKPSSRV